MSLALAPTESFLSRCREAAARPWGAAGDASSAAQDGVELFRTVSSVSGRTTFFGRVLVRGHSVASVRSVLAGGVLREPAWDPFVERSSPVESATSVRARGGRSVLWTDTVQRVECPGRVAVGGALGRAGSLVLRALGTLTLPVSRRFTRVSRSWTTSEDDGAFALLESSSRLDCGEVPWDSVRGVVEGSGWAVIPSPSPSESASVLVLRVCAADLQGCLPRSVAEWLQSHMVVQRLRGLRGYLRSDAHPAGIFPPPPSRPLLEGRALARRRLHRAIALREPPEAPVDLLREPSLPPELRSDRSVLEHAVDPFLFAPQLLAKACAAYGPIERFKYTIAAFVAGLHADVDQLLPRVPAEGQSLKGKLCCRRHRRRASFPPVAFHVRCLHREPLSVGFRLQSRNCSSSSSSTRSSGAPPGGRSERPPASAPRGAGFRMKGRWRYDLTLSPNGSAVFRRSGSCALHFEDRESPSDRALDERVEVSSLPRTGTALVSDWAGGGPIHWRGRMTFADAKNLLVGEVDLVGLAGSELSGRVLYDGSLVSTIRGSWASGVFFDKFACWTPGEFERSVVDTERSRRAERLRSVEKAGAKVDALLRV